MVGEDGHAAIMDLGLAQLLDASRLTQTDQTVGATAYMSPEQAEGSGTDHRTDIWLYDFARGLMTPLTTDPENDFFPVWSSDSSEIVFTSSRPRATIYRLPLGAARNPEPVLADYEEFRDSEQ